ncbi:MAG: alpha-galactosidase [Eubacterium sp.]|nr:alpha-galactosidase [Eubacterium sp.]
MNYSFNFIYKADGEVKKTNSTDNDDFSVVAEISDKLTTLTLQPKREVEFVKFEMTMPFKFNSAQRIFTNGYQSWTVSKEYSPNGSMDEFNPRLMGIEKRKVNPLGIWGAGDLTFHNYPEKSGVFYGYSYGYVRNGNELFLLGSLSEKVGYTIITFNSSAESITIEKELEGVLFNDDTIMLSLATLSGEYNAVFDEYFEMMNIPKPRVQRQCGYTTWYNYYTNVTEDIVSRDLEAISKLDTKIDIFQIDDGYERTVGDWLETDEKKFPNGMKTVADNIHKQGMLAGLWLAPFAVTPKSHIYKQHKDWLVRDEKGKSHYAAHNWGGFYALDIYNSEVRAYLKKVFDTVLNEWGYDMVKLDFLFACSIIPIHGKSRGEIMCEAMELLRELCGDKIILGCGVPLVPAFGKVDFCRIGADVGLCWENKAFSREDVSTQNTLTNTIFRRHLDGRAFLNDPDVFLLRDNNIKMPMSKRKIVADVNSLCGNLLFVSDDVSTYTDEQMKIFIDTITKPKADIINAEFVKDKIIKIDYSLNGKADSLTFDLATGVKI